MKRAFLLIGLVVFVFSGCATVEEKPSEAPKPSVQKQQKEAMNLFQKILEVSEQKGPTPEALEEKIALLRQMPERYPDAPLSQEAYWHIINIYLNQFYPPKVEEAEKTYREFLKKYPRSPLKNAIESTFNLFYFQHKMWDKLERMHRARVKKFIETGRIDSPFYFYMYSLAKMNLGELEEAEKGFKWIILKYPTTQAAKDAKRQLKNIEKLRKKTGGTNGRSQ
ncbi:MAG: outer membrane protein assembly factor BamD [Nitrospirae bacterium]|nr:MAG: outer membrane protein assembly factor BamD [Nitrospirota bacterium]